MGLLGYSATSILAPVIVIGAESFDSGNIPAGGVYKQTFTVPGTYKYFCDPHHGAGMVGTIIVTAS